MSFENGGQGMSVCQPQHQLQLKVTAVPQVYMASSNEQRAKDAIERAEKDGREPGLGEIIWHPLDLKDPRDAKSSAEAFLKKESKLDILINNAAMITDLGNPQKNVDGISESMAINYLGPFVFTRTLLPLLESTAATGDDVRIVNIGSDGHQKVSYFDYGSKEAWNHPFRWSLVPTLERYKYSKLAVHLWTNNLAQRLTTENSKVFVVLVHPGAIMSDGAVNSLNTLPFPSFWVWLLNKSMHPQNQGAFAPVFAACAPRDDPQLFHGAYILPPNVSAPQAKYAMDEGIQQQLFAYTETLLKELGV
ncbi:hypothetical protein DXG03_008430 [Asterophora parasitica]|uniref:NAD(P)-binding protein n=1 Tax=Asterophora parasitica TaxID=117018 RepID=A0A9P7GIJ4_9AGAR|nr:hypothetical protein DXG03_008430 [Asterophora parasitica]